MNAKRFFIAVAVVLLMLAGYNVVIHFAAKRTQRQRFLAALERIPSSAECLFLGNSLVDAACDAPAFAEAWRRAKEESVAVNGALGATSPVEHALILKRILERPQQLKYVVYGFFDDQLNAPVRGEFKDLIGNRALSYYFPNEAAAYYAPGSRLATLRMKLVGRIPMLAERSSLWQKVERLRRKIDQIGMPHKPINRFGRVADFTLLQKDDTDQFTRRCQAVIEEKRGFSPAVEDMLHRARERGVKFLLVEMPMSTKHRETYYAWPAWTQMRAHLRSLAEARGATYLDASDWLQDAGNFEDTVHLSQQGARLFSGRLATNMLSMTYVRSNLVAQLEQHPPLFGSRK